MGTAFVAAALTVRQTMVRSGAAGPYATWARWHPSDESETDEV